MEFAWEFVAVWKKQYFAMIRIQFPEFFRSAVVLLNAFFSYILLRREFFTRVSFGNPAKEKDNMDIVNCEVLYNPPPGMHRTDIIFIHGLHGSTYKTWRQGLYKCSEINKVQLRKHIPLKSDNEKSNLCTECNSTKKKNEKRVESTYEAHISDNENSFIDKRFFCTDTEVSANSIDIQSNLSVYLERNDDDIYMDNINFIRNSFRGSMNAFEKHVNARDRVDQNDSDFLILEDNYCDCSNSQSWISDVAGTTPKNICDSNLAINKEFNYYKLSEFCLSCKKRRNSKSYNNLNETDNDENHFISCSIEKFSNMSDEVFDFEDCDLKDDNDDYETFVNSSFISKDEFGTTLRRQSLKFVNEDNFCNGLRVSNFINSMENKQNVQTDTNCNCIGKSSSDNSEDEMSFGYYLKYEDIYGDSSRLWKQLIFFMRFFMSFVKESYSIYKKILRYTENSEQLSACWPRDWLPIDCPYARVISIDYSTFLWMPIWTKSCHRMSLYEKSLEMAKQLNKLGVGEHPIVWVAHSKGGLFVKQMFINSRHGNGGVSSDLFDKTHSMAFYSVPQHGSILAHFFTPPIVLPSIEIVEIRTGSQMLRKLQDEFQEALKWSKQSRMDVTPPNVVSYTETIPTNMSGVVLQIVFPTTADPGVGELYGIPLDHRMICKFASRDSVLYRDLVGLIKEAYTNVTVN